LAKETCWQGSWRGKRVGKEEGEETGRQGRESLRGCKEEKIDETVFQVESLRFEGQVLNFLPFYQP
jgi:hypothetical protein